MSVLRAAIALPVAVVLLTACGGRSPVSAPVAQAAQPAQASQPVAAAQARAVQRPPAPPPAAVLVAQIRSGLTSSRWPAGFDPARTETGAPEWMRDRCLDVSDTNAARCTYGRPGATRKVALVGDSIAIGWLPALRRAPALQDARIHVLTRRQCANLRGFALPACEAHHTWTLKQVRRLRPELVVMSSRYQGGQTWQQWQAGTARMIKAIQPYTKRIVVLTPPPDVADASRCFQEGLSPARCTRPVSMHWRTYAYAEWKAAGTAARFVDSRPWFCLSERCPAVVGTLPVMFDGQHLTGAYAARIAPLLSDALR
jgi:hypothetical protein